VFGGQPALNLVVNPTSPFGGGMFANLSGGGAPFGQQNLAAGGGLFSQQPGAPEFGTGLGGGPVGFG